mmetsp:Transcript_4574/g.11756  ORF Transcript_4574/g.11756 Transcript_4574/m.11756 type:complete len:217 (-) Transcript_4574:85-735(-)
MFCAESGDAVGYRHSHLPRDHARAAIAALARRAVIAAEVDANQDGSAVGHEQPLPARVIPVTELAELLELPPLPQLPLLPLVLPQVRPTVSSGHEVSLGARRRDGHRTCARLRLSCLVHHLCPRGHPVRQLHLGLDRSPLRRGFLVALHGFSVLLPGLFVLLLGGHGRRRELLVVLLGGHDDPAVRHRVEDDRVGVAHGGGRLGPGHVAQCVVELL